MPGKRLAGALVNSLKAHESLPAAYDRVEAAWVELDAVSRRGP